MKKTILLSTLLTITILNGMEMEIDTPSAELANTVFSIEDICGTIIPHLGNAHNYDTLDEAISTINAIWWVNKSFYTKAKEIYGNQKNFIALIQDLSKRFNKSTEEIATQFATKTSQEYIAAFAALYTALDYRKNEQIILSLFNENVDLKYTSDDPTYFPPLFLAIQYGAWDPTLPIIESLIKHGADIHYTHPKHGNIIQYTAYLYFSVYSCGGLEGRMTSDTILKYLIHAFSGSDEDMRKKLYEEYEYYLLTEEQLKQIEEGIKLDEQRRATKKQKTS